ncbi:MAG: acetylornithine transaminase, partial [Actinobacteria bacterium]|nr:acetylornithine transaminase [Actinomycetota bacterium]
MSNLNAQKKWNKTLQGNYGSPELSLVSAKGSVVTDADGKRYLDFLGGIATNILGHAHPEIVKAVSKQISQLSHVSNFYSHPSVLELSSALQSMVKDSQAKIFFCNSGAEANEAALKLSRLSGRKKIVATQGAFHGRTMGALSLTGQPSKRTPFLPLLKDVKHVPFGDLRAMKKAVTKKIAMVIVEPIMGEAGVVTPPVGYLAGLREICDSNGVLLVIDAVQTGMGRTGQWFGYEDEGIVPDVITIAKGLGGGLPMGAMISLGRCSQSFKPGEHGTTFGANPVVCAAALATIKVIKKEKLLAKVLRDEKFLKESLNGIKGIKEVRGKGLLL